jgi:hypothetical protein
MKKKVLVHDSPPHPVHSQSRTRISANNFQCTTPIYAAAREIQTYYDDVRNGDTRIKMGYYIFKNESTLVSSTSGKSSSPCGTPRPSYLALDILSTIHRSTKIQASNQQPTKIQEITPRMKVKALCSTYIHSRQGTRYIHT